MSYYQCVVIADKPVVEGAVVLVIAATVGGTVPMARLAHPRDCDGSGGPA